VVRLLERFDGHAALRNGLRRIASERGDWAGIPMPLDNERLIIEPSYPKAKELMDIGRKEDSGPTCDGAPIKVRNIFWSDKKRSDVVIFEQDGKVDWSIRIGVHHFTMDLQTLGCSDAWGIEQEHNAVRLLGTLIRHRQLKQYLLTGMFLEQSVRSGVHYVFRRLRPTIAFRDGRILAALCLHAIGYYEGTWAGAMAPSDEICCHLMMMRGDEKMFWRRSNQIAPWRPEAGL
jgi:hypothetical protein